jgi:uncharacterized repeat protein (TIGR01451 family)
VALALAVLAAVAIALWLGVFSQERATASPGPVDLTVTVTSTPASGTTLAQGSTISYTVSVVSDDATYAADDDITLNIDLDNATYVTGSGSTTGGVSCVWAAMPIVCDVPDFTAAGSKTVSFNATVGASGPVLAGAAIDPPITGGVGQVGEVDEGTNALNVDDDDGDDPDAGHDCAAVGEGSDVSVEEEDNFDCTSHAVGTADLTITKFATPAEGTTVMLGSTIGYSITATNTSATTTITNVLIRDILGAALTYASASGSAGVTCTHPTAQQVDCTAASIGPGATATVTIVATVAATSGSVLNGAYVDPTNAITETNEDDDDTLECAAVGEGPGHAPSVESDNFDCASHTAGAVDLTVIKNASPTESTPVATGGTIIYSLTVTNSASATVPATNVAIRDILGTGLTYVSATGTGATCTHTSAQQVDCTAASIAAGGTAAVTITATVSATSGSVYNGARVDPGNTITETNEDADDPDYDCTAVGEGTTTTTEADNFDCTRHTLGGLDLTITKTASPTEATTVTTGSNITYTLTARNATGAPSAATNVAIRDILGTGLTYVSASGTGATCTHTSAQQIDCTAASIAAGGSATVTIVATVSATSGSVLNGARVDPASAIAESNEDADDPDLTCAAVGEGSDAGEVTEPDNFDCTSHTVGGGALLNCPLAGKWAISVWDGSSGKAIADALATCSGVTIVAAYSLDRTTNQFSHYFPGRTDNTLLTLSSMQGILTLAQ